MTFIRTIALALLLLTGAVVTFAQPERADKSTGPSITAVTISISAKGVRFTALGNVGQMRLEVFNSSTSGDPLYSSEFKAGSVQDWALKDNFGQPLADGSYLCVITVRDVSGRLGMKQGSVLVQAGQASLKLAESELTGAVQSEKALTPVADGNATAVTLLAHDGEQGRVVSGRGGLSFSVGDFFAGKDVEQMRLTAKGDLGIGVENPQARLDVGGRIRTGEGILFPDGSVQTTAYVASSLSLSERGGLRRDGQGRLIAKQDDTQMGAKEGLKFAPNISGLGTTNRITKWSDGPNGVVGDSTLSEVGGNIGIGTTTPTTGLDYRHTLAPFLTRDIGTTNFGTPQSAIQIGVTNTASRNVGVGPSFLFFSDNSAGQKQFLGRLSAAWENPTAGQEAGAISFNVRANSADTGALTERMRITSAGNVGIGTTNPAGLLHVRGASPVRILGDVATLAGAEYVDFMARNSPFSTDMGGMRIQRQSATGDVDTLLFAAASGSSMSEVMRVKGNGNVGIGTTNPLYKLHVAAIGNHALYGQSDIGIGVWGQSASNSAVYGQSASGYGVQGLSASGTGVYGVASATTGTAPGVYGETKSGDPTGIGVFGLSNNGRGVQGNSNGSGTGVFGFSNTGTAIFGNSNVNDAIVGTAHVGGKSGVYGLGNNSANGIAGISDSGVGVYGQSSGGTGVSGNGVVGVYGIGDKAGVVGSSPNGFAMQAQGNTTQDRNKGGWVKAMIFFDGNSTIWESYNSFLTGSAANTPPSGFTVTRTDVGRYTIDFGFKVNDRFFSLTTVGGGNSTNSPRIANISSFGGNGGNSIDISISFVTGQYTDNIFWIIVY